MLSQKCNLHILDFEAKVDKTGTKPYFRFKTDSGWYSCFDVDIIEELKKCVGRVVSVNVAVSDTGFKNIRSFNGIVQDAFAGAKIVREINPEIIKVEDKKDPKNVTMYVSYTKDLICAGKSFEEAIKIVKDAQKEFS